MKIKILTLSCLLLLIYSCKKNDSITSIDYPYSSDYGANILNDSISSVKVYRTDTLNVDYSMAANLPINTNLKIIIKGGLWAYRSDPGGPINWKTSPYNNEEQSFTAIESGKGCDLLIIFLRLGKITVEFYENKSITPTKIKNLEVKQ